MKLSYRETARERDRDREDENVIRMERQTDSQRHFVSFG